MTRLNESMETSSTSKLNRIQTPIAVIGMACRLPGDCNTPTDFWKFLLDGGVASTDVPLSRFSHSGHYDGSLRPGTMRSTGGMMLNIDPEDIDAGFFALSQVDAISMDPSQRQLLEVVYEGLENAGLTLESVKRKSYGCFVGSYASDYSDMQNRDPEDRTPSFTVGSGRAMLSNRISHFLDITGPSMTIDTACSGSLISVDLACRYLDSGDADGAIVAGNNLYMSPEHNMDASAMNSAASPTGRCWTFDARADGYIKAEAINMIILKRLDDAIRDGDPIRAVIRGSSTNSDGWTPGIASPSSDAQAAAIRRAYARAGIPDYSETAYLECHGTGTLAGDPIETKAAASVFSQSRVSPLRIGSVKSNIGHSEPAAGISGVLKTILAIENGIIPGNPTFEIPNPNIDFQALNVAPSKLAGTWPKGMLKRASVNSFGYGGSNAHTILEHSTVLAPTHTPPNISSYLTVENDFFASDDEDEELRRVFLFSANDELSLKALAKAYVKHLSNPAVSVKPQDLAHTLSERRTRHFHRGYVVSKDTNFKESQVVYGKLRSSKPRFGFVFTGQGAQWPRMGRELVDSFPTAKKVVQRLDRVLQSLTEPPCWSLLEELTQLRTSEHMRQPEFSQPLVTALQLALLAVLDDWGLRPETVVGHSSGEIAAAAAAGLLTPEEAIEVAYFRGKASLAVQSRKLGMLAVGLGQPDVEIYLKASASVSIACINSPRSVTLSGQAEDLQLLESLIKDDGHFARLLQVDLAYHSEYMTEIASHYFGMLTDSCPDLGSAGGAAEVKFYSTVVGGQMITRADAEYWYSNMVCPVRFSQGLECMIKEGGVDHLIELGPSGALAGPISQIAQSIGGSAATIDYSATLARGLESVKPMFDLAGCMFLAGVPIDFLRVNHITPGERPKIIIDLPNYQWNHSVKYWHESLSSRDWRYRKFPIHDLLGSKVLGTSWQNPSFRRILCLKNVPWLRDHKVGSDVVFPAAGYTAMAVEAMFQTGKSVGLVVDIDHVAHVSYRLRNIRLMRALVLEEDLDHHLYLFLNPREPKDTWYQFSIQTLRDDRWTEHSNGLVRILADAPKQIAEPGLLRPLEHAAAASLWYKALYNVGFNFGPAFQNLLEIEAIPSQRASRVRSKWSYTGQSQTESKYAVHPTIIDSFFQAGVPPLYQGYRTSIDRVFVPKIIDDIIMRARYDQPETSLASTSCAWTCIGRKEGIQNYASNASIYDEKDGQLVFQLTGLRYSELEVDAEVHRPHNYVQLNWKPDVTLLSDARLGDLSLAESDTEALECELDLPKCAVELLSLARHKKPNMSIVEVDIRSPENRSQVLEHTKRSVMPFFTRYAYMSRSSEGFSHAQQRLQHLSGTEFYIHDILGSAPLPLTHETIFDMIILKTSSASTNEFAMVVDRVQQIAASGGFLMIIRPDDFTDASGSGSDESVSNISCDYVDASTILQAARLPIHVRTSIDSADSSLSLHAMLCSAHPLSNDAMPAADYPLVHFSRNVPELIVLRKTLHQLGWAGQVIDPTQAIDLPVETPMVLLDSPSSSFLEDVTEEEWTTLKALLKPGRKLLYVTSGSQYRVTSPGNALFHGLARSLRREDPTLRLKTLDVESLWNWNAAEAMYSVISTFSNSTEDPESEYCERNRVVNISRLLPDEALIKADQEAHTGNELQTKWFRANPLTVCYRCECIGAMDSLNFYETSDQPEILRDDCIEVEIRAASLNFKDIATSMGLVPENEYLLGLEGAGVIRRVGRNVKTRNVGQRVMVYGRGCFANRVQAEPERTLVIPNNITFEQAATMCTAYFTVVYAFMEVTKLRQGQSVLIHSATSGVGIASIHFCQYIGAEIYATAGNEDKRRFLTEQLGILPERIFSSRTTEFGLAIRQATNGRGVDVVLNFLTGDLLDESWRCLADSGVLLEIGKKDIVDRNQLSMEPFNRNCSYRAIDISHPAVNHNLPLTARLLRVVLDLLEAGHIKPIEPHEIFSFAKIPEAMRYMRSGTHMGKIVLSDSAEADIEVAVRPASRTLRLDPQAAYLIVGGLKGLCGSLAILLTQCGAKELIIMSRSGVEDERSKAVLRDVAALGAHTTIFQGDVSCADEISALFRQTPRRIKGIIHGAMVLRDRTFETMTHEDFHAAIQAKHRGTWNLHEVAQQQAVPLEFFTLLSSISGVIGMGGQANYAAGNSFQDAFAAYRHGLGLRGHSINLGIIEDVGYINNNQDIANKIERKSALKGIDERTLHRIIKFSLLQQMYPINPASSMQMITGLPVPLAAESPLLADARFASLVPALSSSSSTTPGDANSAVHAFTQMVKADLDAPTLAKEAVRLVNAQLVKNLGLANDMEPGKSLSTYGIDSLAAVDLRNWLRVQLKAELTTLDILNASTLSSLCEKVVGNVLTTTKN